MSRIHFRCRRITTSSPPLSSHFFSLIYKQGQWHMLTNDIKLLCYLFYDDYDHKHFQDFSNVLLLNEKEKEYLDDIDQTFVIVR
jgi:hypothetical protein